MHVRCSYCRHSFNLSRDYIAMALEKSEKKKYKYHNVECGNCRKQIRVPLDQMRRFVPSDDAESSDEASPEESDPA